MDRNSFILRSMKENQNMKPDSTAVRTAVLLEKGWQTGLSLLEKGLEQNDGRHLKEERLII